MTTLNVDTSQELEKHFMAAAEGAEESKTWLTDWLRENGHLLCSDDNSDPELRQNWDMGVELITEGMRSDRLSDTDEALVLNLLSAGFDQRSLRDLAATAARAHFNEYPDPAGMITALGMRDTRIPARVIRRRWRQFGELKPGRYCYHNHHGTGLLNEIDGLANQVRITFKREIIFELNTVFQDIAVVCGGSVIENILTKKQPSAKAVKNVSAEQLRASIAYSGDTLDWAVKGVLAEAGIRKDTIEGLLQDKGRENAPGVSTSDTAEAEPEVQSNEPLLERLVSARSLNELKDILTEYSEAGTKIPATNFDNKQINDLSNLFQSAVERKDLMPLFARCVALLYQSADSASVVTNLLIGIQPVPLSWRDAEVFTAVTSELSAKMVKAWLTVTKDVVGTEQAVELIAELPLKLSGTTERALATDTETSRQLEKTLQERAQQGAASPDQLVWLWKSKKFDSSVLRDPQVVLKAVDDTAAQGTTNARRELKSLLMDNADFQNQLAGHGEENAVRRFVRSARHTQMLNPREKQSLLIKIVRLYPDKKHLVEQKKKAKQKTEIPNITSIRSYERRRRELQHLINVKVPENARDIARAREHGDLRENAEYKAAKEEQGRLSTRRSELEQGLNEVTPTDFHDADVDDRVVPGCVAVLKDARGELHEYVVLGVWDSDPEQNHISLDTPLGKQLLGKKQGDSLTLPSGQQAELAEVRSLPQEMIAWLGSTDNE